MINKIKKTGRPTAYKKEYAEQTYKLCLLGYTDKDLAEFFNVSKVTINTWKKKHKDFLYSVTRGKDLADADVAASFYKRATGYRYDEVHQELRDGELQVTRVITKEVVPDAGAALNWLKNRQPEIWRDKQEVRHDLPEGTGVVVAYEPVAIEQFEKMAKINEEDRIRRQREFKENGA